MIRNYRHSTMGSIFRGTDHPPTRTALLTANWRGCEGGRRIAGDCDELAQWVSQLVAPLSNRVRTPAVQRIAPVDAFEHVTQLSRGDRDHPIGWRRPDKAAALQSLGIKR